MGRRAESRERIEAQVIEVARRRLVSDGAAALSLRAVARDLGMVSSAVYRYVASRDELLTLLLVDAYTDLADAVDAARAGVPDDWMGELSAIAHAVRDWALAQPERWALLYGSPVPGYHAPGERTVGPGTRVVGAVFSAVAHGVSAGAIGAEGVPVAQPVSADFDRIRGEFGVGFGDEVMATCFVFWAALVGAVSLEVFGQYGPDTLTDPAQVFDLQVQLLLNRLLEK